MISNNNLKKLGQLDRIEYFLKKQSLGERPHLTDGWTYFFSIFNVSLLMCFATLMAGVGAEAFFHLLNRVLICGGIILLLYFIVNALALKNWEKKEKQIEVEYFSLEPRVKDLTKDIFNKNVMGINPLELMKQVKLIQPMVEEELKKQKKSTKKKR